MDGSVQYTFGRSLHIVLPLNRINSVDAELMYDNICPMIGEERVQGRIESFSVE